MKIKIYNDRPDYVGGTKYYKRFQNIMMEFGVVTNVSEVHGSLYYLLKVDLLISKFIGFSFISLLRLVFCYILGYTHIFGSNIFAPKFVRKLLAIRVIAWFPDFQMHDLPDMFSSKQINSRKRFEKLLLNKCDFVVVQNVTDQLRIAEKVGLNRVSILKFFHPIDSLVNECKIKKKKGRRYILLAAQGWRHKRIDHVIRAYLDSTKFYTLKIIGPMNDPRNRKYSTALQTLVNESDVDYLGVVSEEEKIDLFRNAAAIINYSLYEGWNSSVEEAISYQIPIILSDIPIHREQVPTATFIKSDEELTSIFSGSLAFNKKLNFNKLDEIRRKTVIDFIEKIQ